MTDRDHHSTTPTTAGRDSFPAEDYLVDMWGQDSFPASDPPGCLPPTFTKRSRVESAESQHGHVEPTV
jgi:hypothetical protein